MTEKSRLPLILIVVFAVFIAGLVAFIVFAGFQRVDLVSKDYYAEEILYQQQIDREQRVQEDPSLVSLTYSPESAELRVHIRDPEGVTGTLTLYRPSNADLDRTVALNLTGGGLQVVPVTGLARGLWRARINWTVDGAEYSHEKSIVLR